MRNSAATSNFSSNKRTVMDEITIARSQDPEAECREILKVSGRVTIAQASGFREALLGALDAAKELQVDLSGVTQIDLAGLQLLCAAHQSAESVGKRFEVLAGGNEIFRSVVSDAGFPRHVGCARDTSCSCIWIEGEK
jgi:anti-anti-sigma regulatory factor